MREKTRLFFSHWVSLVFVLALSWQIFIFHIYQKLTTALFFRSDIDGIWEKLGAIEQVASAAQRTMLQHTLVESLATVGITSLILGVSRLEHVEQAVAALTAAPSL